MAVADSRVGDVALSNHTLITCLKRPAVEALDGIAFFDLSQPVFFEAGLRNDAVQPQSNTEGT